jgi:hypothetical protein
MSAHAAHLPICGSRRCRVQYAAEYQAIPLRVLRGEIEVCLANPAHTLQRCAVEKDGTENALRVLVRNVNCHSQDRIEIRWRGLPDGGWGTHHVRKNSWR